MLKSVLLCFIVVSVYVFHVGEVWRGGFSFEIGWVFSIFVRLFGNGLISTLDVVISCDFRWVFLPVFLVSA